MKELWHNLKFVWQYSKDQKWNLVKYIFVNLLIVAMCIVVPILGAKAIIFLTNNDFYQLLFTGTLLFIVECICSCLYFFTSYYSTVIYKECFIKIQTDLGKQILKLENTVIDANSAGVFIQRLTNDTSRLADIFNILNMYLTNIVIDLGIFVAIFLINKIVFVYLVIIILLFYVIDKKRVTKFNEKDRIFRKQEEKVAGFVGEIVRGIRDIKMLNAEESFLSELHSEVVTVNQMRYDMQKVNRNYHLLENLSYDFLNTLLLLFLLVYLILYGRLAVASALIIHNYSGRLVSIVGNIGKLLDSVKDFNLSSSRVFAIIHGDEFRKESFGKKHLNKVEGNFEFKHVAFSYGKGEVLKDVSFKINANETVAFVGRSGAGKSTIFSLLCKMYNVDRGKITIDGVDIQELDRETIRGNITIISQNPYIFNLSIRDNLRLVKKDVTEEEMKEACRSACLHDFIMSLPKQYDTIIGEGGVNLSGGQKQRLAIARALLQKTEIILFDEATSALDNETQFQIQEAINHLKKEYTILIIAHRLSTIIDCDRILFLEEGRILAEGTHQELLKNFKEYQQLYETEIKTSNI